MGFEDVGNCRHPRFKKILWSTGALVKQLQGQQFVFLHWEAMPGRKWMFIDGVIGNLQHGQ
jgi:hypothetical protein